MCCNARRQMQAEADLATLTTTHKENVRLYRDLEQKYLMALNAVHLGIELVKSKEAELERLRTGLQKIQRDGYTQYRLERLMEKPDACS